MLNADSDFLTAHDIASEATWADSYGASDRDGARKRYEQTRQWHFVDIELDGPNLSLELADLIDDASVAGA
jgi:hypothetical protein